MTFEKLDKLFWKLSFSLQGVNFTLQFLDIDQQNYNTNKALWMARQ